MVIADDRGYDDIIEGIEAAPDEKEDLEALIKMMQQSKSPKRKNS